MKRWLVLSLLSFCSITHAGPGEDFRALVDEVWDWEVQQSPERATYLGVDGLNDRWTDQSLSAHISRYTKQGEFLGSLLALDSNSLALDDQLSYAMLQRRLEESRKYYEQGLYLMRYNMRSGPQSSHGTANYAPFNNERDFRNWLSRMRAVPQLLAQHMELMEEGINRDRVPARIVMQRVPAQLDKVVTDNPEESPWYKPFKSMPESIDSTVADQIQSEARSIIANQVTPAFEEFRDFMVSSYLPATREEPGIGSLPGGEEIYRFLAARFTTTTMTPEEIHETGKREVARILQEMEQVKTSVDFQGDLTAFNEFLRTDPQFYYESSEALLEGYQAISKRLDPELVNLFGKLPRMPYGVRAIPMETAPDTTTAYYSGPAANGTRAGFYWVNLYRPEVRPKYEMEVLSVHEAVPGHHLQIALAQELEGVPEFRKHSGVTAFIEGWGLYSERLGYQMGLYTDPYSKYGQLTYDMWRAVRLVVDTGIHYFGWSRQEAIDYFLAHAGKSETDIINEIDRYIGNPGQALAYKIGQLKMLELRAQAEAALGDDFDIRSFHDEMLGAGAIPLDALGARMNRWVAAQR